MVLFVEQLLFYDYQLFFFLQVWGKVTFPASSVVQGIGNRGKTGGMGKRQYLSTQQNAEAPSTGPSGGVGVGG